MWDPRLTCQVPTHSPFIHALSADITKNLFWDG